MRRFLGVVVAPALVIGLMAASGCVVADCDGVTEEFTYTWDGEHVVLMEVFINGQQTDDTVSRRGFTRKFSLTFPWFEAGVNWSDIGPNDEVEFRFVQFAQNGTRQVGAMQSFDHVKAEC